MSCLRSIEIDESKLDEYLVHARDAAFFAGLAYFPTSDKNNPDYEKIKFLGYTLLPSPFLRSEFEYAVNIQKDWNYLTHVIANSHDLIYQGIKELIKVDDFFVKLWNIYLLSREHSKNQVNIRLLTNLN